MGDDAGPTASRAAVAGGLAVIYVVWGSTYLAIKVAVQTVPPFLMAGTRFLIAGTLLFGWTWWRGAARPTPRHWKNAAIAGVLLLLVGNGGVTFAQQTVPSGVAALIVATLPAWLVLLNWGWVDRRRPRLLEAVGIAVGLAGVAVLALPGGGATADVPLGGVAALTAASVGWAIGSLYARGADFPPSAAQVTGMEMLIGGTVLTGVGLLTGEPTRFDPAAISGASAMSFAYLVVAAVVVLPVYTWLLTVASPGLVGTYAFVNPVVAVGLGWALAGEQLTPHTLAAAALVVIGVALLTWPRAKPAAPTPADPEAHA